MLVSMMTRHMASRCDRDGISFLYLRWSKASAAHWLVLTLWML